MWCTPRCGAPPGVVHPQVWCTLTQAGRQAAAASPPATDSRPPGQAPPQGWPGDAHQPLPGPPPHLGEQLGDEVLALRADGRGVGEGQRPLQDIVKGGVTPRAPAAEPPPSKSSAGRAAAGARQWGPTAIGGSPQGPLRRGPAALPPPAQPAWRVHGEAAGARCALASSVLGRRAAGGATAEGCLPGGRGALELSSATTLPQTREGQSRAEPHTHRTEGLGLCFTRLKGVAVDQPSSNPQQPNEQQSRAAHNTKQKAWVCFAHLKGVVP